MTDMYISLKELSNAQSDWFNRITDCSITVYWSELGKAGIWWLIPASCVYSFTLIVDTQLGQKSGALD